MISYIQPCLSFLYPSVNSLGSSMFHRRGATGYGRFDVENFTYRRAIVVNPAEAKYPIVDSH